MASGVVKDACFFLSSCAAVPTARMFPELLLARHEKAAVVSSRRVQTYPQQETGSSSSSRAFLRVRKHFFPPQQDSVA